MSPSRFFAYLDRLRWIKRWGLKRNAYEENVMEHSWQVATIAHSLAIIRRDVLKLQDDFTPEQVATTALYHDSSEVITGDLPTPIKYHSPTITEAYKRIEDEAEQEIHQMLPQPLQQAYRPFLLHAEVAPSINKIIKSADIISAFLKCQTEVKTGNQEFSSAMSEIEQSIDALRCEEVDYFMAHFVDSYELTLDELLARHDERHR